MREASDPNPTPAPPSVADPGPQLIPGSPLLAGMRKGVTSIFTITMIATYVGIGALSHDLGFPLGWTLFATVLIWAAPAHVIFITGLAAGSALIEIAIAVALSGVRLMPMTITLQPLLRRPGTRIWSLLLPAHFTAISIWVEGLRLLPHVHPSQRIAYINGFGLTLAIYAIASALAGYLMSAQLPFALAAALLFTTPVAFLLSLINSSRGLMDYSALLLGLVLGPALAVTGLGLDLVWTGLIGGSIAYGLHRWRRSRP
jgi:predicted branched-subunit amino acid permease